MKKILSGFLLIVSALFSQAQSQEPYMTKTLQDEQFSKLEVSTSHGNIAVTKVDAARARVEVYIEANGIGDRHLSKDEIKSRLEKFYELEVAVSNGMLSAIAKSKNNTLNIKSGLSISFRIYTSAAVSSNLKTSHGDIDLSGMAGEQELSTSHGNIHADNIAGSIKGGTSHGDVDVKEISNGVDVSTSHGNVKADHCEGTIKLSTSKGNLTLNHVKGKIRGNTSHGNVEGDMVEGEVIAVTSHGDIGFSNLDATIDASTSHGNVTLQLPKGKGINIDLRGKKINLEKLENFSGSKQEHSMKGTLNGGGMIIKAETTKGSINLEFK